MPNLKLNTTYTFDLRGKLALPPLSEQEVAEFLTDGRVAGLLAERLYVKFFGDISLAGNAGKAYDVLDQGGNWYESRAITKRGFTTIPSSMWGAGRELDVRPLSRPDQQPARVRLL